MIAVPAFAQTVDEPFVSAGQVTVGGIATDTSGKDLSKFMETEYKWAPDSLFQKWSVPGMMSELK